MLRADQVKALSAWVESRYACSVVRPDDGVLAIMLTLLHAFAPAVPGLAAVLGRLEEAASRHSVTVPTPFGTLVVLSAASLVDDLTHARALAHEGTHASQVQALGGPQAAADYASGELRALRETHACVAAAWLGYLLTGALPASGDDVVRSLESHVYALDDGELALARDVASSSLETMRAGGCPPIRTCEGLLGWLREHAPEAIVAERLAARTRAAGGGA